MGGLKQTLKFNGEIKRDRVSKVIEGIIASWKHTPRGASLQLADSHSLASLSLY